VGVDGINFIIVSATKCITLLLQIAQSPFFFVLSLVSIVPFAQRVKSRYYGYSHTQYTTGRVPHVFNL